MSKRKQNKISNKGLFIVVAIFGICLIGGLIAYGAYVSNNIQHIFVREHRHVGERLYSETVELDLYANYPQSPTRLMEFYNTAFFLLNSNIIIYDNVMMEVINFQRNLFSAELLSLSTPQQQFETLRRNLEELYAGGGVTLRRSTIENVRHDFYDQRTALVYVIHPFMFAPDLHRIYHLIMDENDMWKINSWVLTDSEFNIIE